MIRLEVESAGADGEASARRCSRVERRRRRRRVVLLMFAWWCATGTGLAHPAFLTAAEITVEADGRFHGRAEFDTLAFVLNDTSARIGNEPMELLLAGPRDNLAKQLADAKGRFLHGFQVTTDAGPSVVDQLSFPEADEVVAWRDTRRPVLPVVIPVAVSGHLPAGARCLAVRFPAVLEQVILNVERPGEEPFMEPVEAGKESTSLPVQLAAAGKPATSQAHAPTGSMVNNPEAARLQTAAWPRGTGFLVILGLVIPLSFAGAFVGARLTAKR